MKRFRFFHEIFGRQLERDGALSVRFENAHEIMDEFRQAGYQVSGGAVVDTNLGLYQIMYLA